VKIIGVDRLRPALNFPRKNRLIKTDDFSSVFSFRKRITGQFLVIHYRYNQLGWPRLGLIVAGRITRLSVHRNYMRRVLRELFRAQQHLNSLDLVIRAQKTFTKADYSGIETEFIELLSKLHCKTGQQENG
jgi:ribonuclease P protein component